MEKIGQKVIKLLGELFDDIIWLLKYVLFNRSVQKYGGPTIMVLYLLLQGLLAYLCHFILIPSFRICWGTFENTDEEQGAFNFVNVFIVIGYFTSFMCTINYILVIIVGPGIQEKIDISQIQGSIDNEENMASQGLQKCKKCPNIKVYGTHHCSVCNRCVPMMDHHCMWTNQCIGKRNRLIFISLLFFGSLGCYLFTQFVNHSNFDTVCTYHLHREGNVLKKDLLQRSMGQNSLFNTIIDIEDMTKAQIEATQKLDCRLSSKQITMIHFLGGLLGLVLKVVFGLFCFNCYLLYGHRGLTYIEFKKQMNKNIQRYAERHDPEGRAGQKKEQ